MCSFMSHALKLTINQIKINHAPNEERRTNATLKEAHLAGELSRNPFGKQTGNLRLAVR